MYSCTSRIRMRTLRPLRCRQMRTLRPLRCRQMRTLRPLRCPLCQYYWTRRTCWRAMGTTMSRGRAGGNFRRARPPRRQSDGYEAAGPPCQTPAHARQGLASPNRGGAGIRLPPATGGGMGRGRDRGIFNRPARRLIKPWRRGADPPAVRLASRRRMHGGHVRTAAPAAGPVHASRALRLAEAMAPFPMRRAITSSQSPTTGALAEAMAPFPMRRDRRRSLRSHQMRDHTSIPALRCASVRAAAGDGCKTTPRGGGRAGPCNRF